jgi:hypothetical protein
MRIDAVVFYSRMTFGLIDQAEDERQILAVIFQHWREGRCNNMLLQDMRGGAFVLGTKTCRSAGLGEVGPIR